MVVLYQIAPFERVIERQKAKGISLRFLLGGTAYSATVDYFFALRAAAAATVAADAASFTFLSASVLLCFCVACLCVAFGDLSPMDCSFSRAPQKPTLDYAEVQGIGTVPTAFAAVRCFTHFGWLFAAFARDLV